MGATMAAAGIDLDLAPVVDVNVNPTNPAIGALERSFSADPAIVAAMAEAEIRGLHEQGVRAAIKHFPGLGSATANTDFDDVDVTKTWTDAELEPYRSLIAAGVPDAVMTGHIVNDTLRPGRSGIAVRRHGRRPASPRSSAGRASSSPTTWAPRRSPRRYARDEAIALALEAGNDLLLFANQTVYVADLAAEVVDTHRRPRRVRADRRGADRRVDRAARHRWPWAAPIE